MIQKGFYKTLNGEDAVVAQIKPVGTLAWAARGAIKEDNVYFLTSWSLSGNNHNNSFFDLMIIEKGPQG